MGDPGCEVGGEVGGGGGADGDVVGAVFGVAAVAGDVVPLEDFGGFGVGV